VGRGGGGCRCHSGGVARRCWRTTSPAGGWRPVGRGREVGPADRAPRRAPPYRGVRGVRGSTVGARTPRMRAIRGSVRGSRMHRSRRLAGRVMASPLPRHRRVRPRRCRCRGWGWWVTNSGPAIAFLAPSRQPGRFQLAEGELDGAGLERVTGLSEASPSCLTVWRSPPAAARPGPTGGTWTGQRRPAPGPGRHRRGPRPRPRTTGGRRGRPGRRTEPDGGCESGCLPARRRSARPQQHGAGPSASLPR
jgi:hypothetical protein